MKKILLILLLISSMTVLSQDFTTGAITFSGNLSGQIDINSTTTTLTLTGPSNVWFAVGFGGSNMSAGADIFRTDGTTIEDARSTGRFRPPNDTQQDWTLVSNTVSGAARTIIATRANNTGDGNDFVFNANASSISMIWAVGPSTNTSLRHSTRGATAVGVTLSTSDVQLLDFDLYPNPASANVTVQLPSDTNKADVAFYDSIGRLALSQKITNSNEQINVASLSKGIYIIKVVTDNKIGTQKFIKE